jgi:hypothetical protein
MIRYRYLALSIVIITCRAVERNSQLEEVTPSLFTTVRMLNTVIVSAAQVVIDGEAGTIMNSESDRTLLDPTQFIKPLVIPFVDPMADTSSGLPRMAIAIRLGKDGAQSKPFKVVVDSGSTAMTVKRANVENQLWFRQLKPARPYSIKYFAAASTGHLYVMDVQVCSNDAHQFIVLTRRTLCSDRHRRTKYPHSGYGSVCNRQCPAGV